MPFDILSRLNSARMELLDLGLRNPLINYRTRVRKIDVVGELSREIYRILVTEGKAMTFAAVPKEVLDEESSVVKDLFDDVEPDWESVFAGDDKVDENGLVKRHVDTKLQTRLTPSSLHAKLLSLHNDARTYIEEQGVNILFLALGFLHWYESDNSNQERRAPLILVPVEISRTSVRERFQVTYTGDEIGANLSLYEKLKTEFTIQLPELNADDGLDVERYLAEVADKVAGQPRWRVNPSEIVLGFFSFGKFLMYKDLASDAWPEGKRPTDHPILTAVLGDGFREGDLTAPDDANVDVLVSPQDVHQVLDADSSQVLAILDVNAGHNMVIQGPPGTGKSQTITNIIAESIGLGKQVLFVSEKMAALEVVKRRLDMVGLGDAALELHSHKTHKKAVLKELERTLRLGKPMNRDVADDIQALTNLRDRLNTYCEAANTPILNTRVTPVVAIGRYIALGKDAATLPRLDFAAMQSWMDADYKQNRLRVEELRRHLSAIGVPCQSPFWGIRRTVLLPADERRLRQLLQEAHSLAESVRAAGTGLAKTLKLQAPESATEVAVACRAAIRASEAPHLEGVHLSSSEWQARRDDLKRLIDAGARLAELHRRFDSHLIANAWDQDLVIERQHIVTYGKKWWRFLSGDYRRAKTRLAGLCKKLLPSDADQCVALVDAVLDAHRQRETYRRFETLGASLFGAQWQREASNWPALAKLVEWIVTLYGEIGDRQIPSGIISFLEGASRLHDLRGNADAVLAKLKARCSKMDELAAELKIELQPPAQESAEPRTLASLPFSDQLRLTTTWSEHFDKLAAIVRYNVLAVEFRNSGLGFVLPLAESWDRAEDDLVRAFDAA